jgi:hypothetical protein
MKALFVAWRSDEQAGWGPIGRLEYDGRQYRFCYVKGARTLPGFRPFPGMENVEEIYESQDLFPLFANRLLSKARREYDDFLQWGGFDPDNPPDPIAILGVTEGIRQTDAIEVFPCPAPDVEGCYLSKFFLHGIRWMTPDAIERINDLQPDELLTVEPDTHNPADQNAVGVFTHDGAKIGYVPRYFAHDVHRLLTGCGDEFLEIVVERVNSDAPMQHRVLCRIRACWPDGFEPCSGDAFMPIPSGISARCP